MCVFWNERSIQLYLKCNLWMLFNLPIYIVLWEVWRTYRIYATTSRFKNKSKCNFGEKIATKIDGSNISRTWNSWKNIICSVRCYCINMRWAANSYAGLWFYCFYNISSNNPSPNSNPKRPSRTLCCCLILLNNEYIPISNQHLTCCR